MTLGTIGAGGSSVLATADRAKADGILSLLAAQPDDPTLPEQVHGLQHCLDSGGTFRLSQDASSIFTKTLCKIPWFLLVECLEAR